MNWLKANAAPNPSLSYRNSILLSAFALIANSLFIPSASAESITKKAFAGGLIEGCSKNRPAETCSCYAKSVTSRYNDEQLNAMYRQMKLKPESRKMFFLVHAPEMIRCIKRPQSAE